MRKSKLLIFGLMFLGVGIIAPFASDGAIYYVSPTGDAGWSSCTNRSTPCPVSTAMRSAVAGDVVRFLPGTYQPPSTVRWEAPAWNPSNSGTSSNPITFISDTLHGATILDAADAATNGNGAIGAYLRNYIIWDGFRLIKDKDTGRYASSIAIITDGNYNTIRNMDGTGVAHRYHTNGTIVSIHGGTGNRVYNNIFHDQTQATNPVEAAVNSSAIYVFETNETYVYNNTIYNCHNGIAWKTGPNRINIHNNYLYNISRAAFFPTIEMNGTTDMFVHHNVVRNAFRFLDAEDSPATTYYNLKVYNNTIYHSGSMTGRGIFYGMDRGVQGGRNTEFYNNIFYVGGSTRFMEIYDNTSSSAFPTTLDHNLYYNSSGSPSWTRNSTTSTTLAAWRSTTGRESNSVTSNPQFQNSSGSLNTVTDFKLATNSPVRGSGRNQEHLGAYTNDSLVIGYPSSQGGGGGVVRPDSPQNLRVTN